VERRPFVTGHREEEKLRGNVREKQNLCAIEGERERGKERKKELKEKSRKIENGC